MKTVSVVLLGLLWGNVALAQEARRTEFTNLGDLQMIAYYFPESRQHEFVLFGNARSSISGGEGSLSSYPKFIRGN